MLPGRKRPAMNSPSPKTFDAVQSVRAIRDAVSAVIAQMSVEGENRWLRTEELTDPTLRRLMERASTAAGRDDKGVGKSDGTRIRIDRHLRGFGPPRAGAICEIVRVSSAVPNRHTHAPARTAGACAARAVPARRRRAWRTKNSTPSR